MCAILDANVVGDVVDERTDAGRLFKEMWLDKGRKLVSCSALMKEAYLKQLQELQRKGRLRVVGNDDLGPQMEMVKGLNLCRSEDYHVLALARLSGARLLYTRDTRLEADFGNPDIIRGPQGNVYPVRDSKNANRRRRQMLIRRDLCAGDAGARRKRRRRKGSRR